MLRHIPLSAKQVMPLVEGWRMAVTAAGAHADDAGLARTGDWLPAAVPGTAAGALADAGRFDVDRPEPLHDKDVWFACDVEVDDPGNRLLCLEGLATVAEVYWNGLRVLDSSSMYAAHRVPVVAERRNRLSIAFRALQPWLDRKGPRARWRPQLATSQGLRLVRTTLLGHMSGWCPDVHAVGPWRPVSLVTPDARDLHLEDLKTDLRDDGTGTLDVSFRLDPEEEAPRVSCAGTSAFASRGEDGTWRAHLEIADVAPWWPHTHGTPALHAVTVEVAGRAYDLGRTGFRRIAVDRGADGKGFALRINGVPVFARGAVWTNADILRLPGGSDSYAPWLDLAVEGGMNMLRIGGTMAYESPAFFELCDEKGIMVWQDFMFANYDYPVADEAFAATVRAEADQVLAGIQACPSLTVLCGGSEIYQQAAMLGLPESRYRGPLTEEILPGRAAHWRPDVPYVPNSPCGGAQPFSPNEGIAHYYGNSAYRRPLEDARRAGVRFAAETLAFSHVPQQRTLDSHLPVMPGHDPRWKARVPRDRGVGWDFEDVRDHYFEDVFGERPADVRYGDPARYLDQSRVVTGAVIEATMAEWRRAASSCAGALVWTWQDLLPGAGWGLVDATGEPKPAWYAMKRACRPVQVMMTDEGTNGLSVHAVNETGQDVPVVLSLACLRDGATPVVQGRREMTLGARQAVEIPATDLFGAFFDTTWAFRFGPLSHDVTVARLADPVTGSVLADAFLFPAGWRHERHAPALAAGLSQDSDGTWWLGLETDRLLRSVHVDDENFRPDDDWFHLAPGAKKMLRLRRRPQAASDARPHGTITMLNATGRIGYGND